jgi:hypothetical protein
MSWTRRSGSTQRNDHRVPAFALIHSPLVGPVTWSAVADELSRRQVGVVVPDLGAPVETETADIGSGTLHRPRGRLRPSRSQRRWSWSDIPEPARSCLRSATRWIALARATSSSTQAYRVRTNHARGRVDSLDTSTRSTRRASVFPIGPTRICARRSPFPPSGPRC